MINQVQQLEQSSQVTTSSQIVIQVIKPKPITIKPTIQEEKNDSRWNEVSLEESQVSFILRLLDQYLKCPSIMSKMRYDRQYVLNIYKTFAYFNQVPNKQRVKDYWNKQKYLDRKLKKNWNSCLNNEKKESKKNGLY